MDDHVPELDLTPEPLAFHEPAAAEKELEEESPTVAVRELGRWDYSN